MVTKKTGVALFKILLGLVMLTPLTACSQNREPAGRPEAKTKGGGLTSGAQVDRAKVPIPPIDAAAPAEFETATFGLG